MELKQESYDVVLLIGNGFDLNLGLETSYPSFIKSFYFYELLTKENQLCRHLESIHKLENWIDIEKELKKYSKKVGTHDTKFHEEFKELTLKLKRYLSDISYYNLNTDSLAYRLITSVSEHNALIIDFNYTHTVERILENIGIEYNTDSANIEHIKIHGSINDNIIFGVEDKSDIAEGHIFLKKSVNINFNAIDFSKAMLDSENFIVFGHSLGETDHTYLVDYFRSTSSKHKKSEKQNVSIYYHGEKGYHDLFSQIDKMTSYSISGFKQNTNIEVIDSAKTKIETETPNT